MLIVYRHPYSQHSRRVLALLEIAGAEYRAETIALDEGEHLSSEFLAINPNHQVPALFDDGFMLTESNAIMRYLCGKLALTDWYPDDLETRALVDQWLDWNQSRLSPAVIGIVLNKVFLGEAGDAEAIARGEASLEELGPILARRLAEGDWLVGGSPTIADLSVASNISQLELAGAVPDEKALHDWYARVCEIAGFRKTLPPPLDAAA